MKSLAILVAFAVALPAVQAGYDHDLDHAVWHDPAADMFPAPDDVQAAIDAVVDHPWMTVHTMGQSVEGRPIRVVEITDPASEVPMDQRVVTFIMTQQHGNEPAGTPAALQLLDDLANDAAGRGWLENQILLLMPQSNPDGAFAEQRANMDGEDINRDHVDVGTPEAAAIHNVLTTWDVHLAFDHHEYGGQGVGYPSPVQVYDFDVTTMYPRHGNVRQPTLDLSVHLHEDVVQPALEEAGYTHGDYGQTTITVGDQSVPLEQVAGGPDPGILRNNVGLNNVAGLLVESFVSPQETPFQSFERRVASHRVVMDAVLAYAHEEAQAIIDAKRSSEDLNLDQPMTRYVEGDTDAPLAMAYRTDGAHEEVVARHGLPTALVDDDGFIFLLDHKRGGLVAAMVHPESSRAVADGEAVEHPGTPPILLSAPDYQRPGIEEEAPLESEPDDAMIPAAAPVLAIMAVLGLLVVTRRR